MKKLPGWLKGILVLGFIYLFFFQPIPFYIESPGGAFGLDDMVEVNHKFSDEEGDFYITTVGIQQATPFTSLSSVLPFRDILSEQELFGDVSDFEEYDSIQQFYMDSSINTAIQVAFDEADMEYDMNYNGVYVLQVLDESSFAGDLKVGDTVTAVDGNTFENSHDFIDYVADKEVGDTVQIDFVRDGAEYSANGELILLESGVPGVGIGLVDHTNIVTNPPVTIHSGYIGGPSAGLMFSLQIYNQLIDGNLRGDYNIAGTGTIEPDGTVGRIGGIQKKVVASDDEGASIFFAPDDEITDEMRQYFPDIRTNYEEALEAAEAIDTDMQIVPVKTFSDAVEFLEEFSLNEEVKAEVIPMATLSTPQFHPILDLQVANNWYIVTNG